MRVKLEASQKQVVESMKANKELVAKKGAELLKTSYDAVANACFI